MVENANVFLMFRVTVSISYFDLMLNYVAWCCQAKLRCMCIIALVMPYFSVVACMPLYLVYALFLLMFSTKLLIIISLLIETYITLLCKR